jgi:hypothetical protein
MNAQESSAARSFITEILTQVREQPIECAKDLLYGLLVLGDDTLPILEPVRTLYREICDLEAKLNTAIANHGEKTGRPIPAQKSS